MSNCLLIKHTERNYSFFSFFLIDLSNPYKYLFAADKYVGKNKFYRLAHIFMQMAVGLVNWTSLGTKRFRFFLS